jgi:hypothetical protein
MSAVGVVRVLVADAFLIGLHDGERLFRRVCGAGGDLCAGVVDVVPDGLQSVGEDQGVAAGAALGDLVGDAHRGDRQGTDPGQFVDGDVREIVAAKAGRQGE